MMSKTTEADHRMADIASGLRARAQIRRRHQEKYIEVQCLKGCHSLKGRFRVERAMLKNSENKYACVWCGTVQVLRTSDSEELKQIQDRSAFEHLRQQSAWEAEAKELGI